MVNAFAGPLAAGRGLVNHVPCAAFCYTYDHIRGLDGMAAVQALMAAEAYRQLFLCVAEELKQPREESDRLRIRPVGGGLVDGPVHDRRGFVEHLGHHH